MKNRQENLATLATWQHPLENPRHVRGSTRIYDVRMVQFVLKIEKSSHIIGARGSQNLRPPSPIMAPGFNSYSLCVSMHCFALEKILQHQNHVRTVHMNVLEFDDYLSLVDDSLCLRTTSTDIELNIFQKHVFLPSLLKFTLICESGQTTNFNKLYFRWHLPYFHRSYETYISENHTSKTWFQLACLQKSNTLKDKNLL